MPVISIPPFTCLILPVWFGVLFCNTIDCLISGVSKHSRSDDSFWKHRWGYCKWLRKGVGKCGSKIEYHIAVSIHVMDNTIWDRRWSRRSMCKYTIHCNNCYHWLGILNCVLPSISLYKTCCGTNPCPIRTDRTIYQICMTFSNTKFDCQIAICAKLIQYLAGCDK